MGPPSSPPFPHTCGRVELLNLMEYAHRCATGEPLYLALEDLDEKALHLHLFVERCDTCRRWYDNACRVYARSAVSPPSVPEVKEAAVAARPPDKIISVAAASGPGSFQQKWEAQPGASGLEQFTRTLEWLRDGQPGSHRWLVTLKLLRDDGNDVRRLRELDGLCVQLLRYPSPGAPPQCLQTRLSLDADYNLVSLTEVWVVERAEQEAPVAVVPLVDGERPASA
jgi:hypothetical protein